MGGSPSIRVPKNKPGLLSEVFKPMAFKCDVSMSNHNFGACFKPYRDRSNLQYSPGFDLVQPGGGRKKYSSSEGKVD
jgi:hypothetical protein